MNSSSASLDRREKRKLKTRARIEDAAYNLFKRHGIEETNIEMICREADVARRTFYSHFANKHALLGGLGVSRLYSQSEAMLRPIMERYSSTWDRLEAMIDYIESTFASYEEIDRLLMISAPASLLANDPEQQRQINVGAMNSFSELIATGQANGDARDEFSPEMLAAMIIGTLNSLTISWAIDPDFPIFDRLEEARVLFETVICREPV